MQMHFIAWLCYKLLTEWLTLHWSADPGQLAAGLFAFTSADGCLLVTSSAVVNSTSQVWNLTQSWKKFKGKPWRRHPKTNITWKKKNWRPIWGAIRSFAVLVARASAILPCEFSLVVHLFSVMVIIATSFEVNYAVMWFWKSNNNINNLYFHTVLKLNSFWGGAEIKLNQRNRINLNVGFCREEKTGEPGKKTLGTE